MYAIASYSLGLPRNDTHGSGPATAINIFTACLTQSWPCMQGIYDRARPASGRGHVLWANADGTWSSAPKKRETEEREKESTRIYVRPPSEGVRYQERGTRDRARQ